MDLVDTVSRALKHPERTLGLAKRALNQWLDAPDDALARPLFVFGCQRSGTTMLLDTLMRAPGMWVHPEKSQVAYDDFRLRAPATVSLVTSLTPGSWAIYKPLCDSHLADRVLDAHDDAEAVWMVRRWEDVAASAVRKWGSHQADVVRDLAAGNTEALGWRAERVPPALVDQLATLAAEGLSDLEGAALFWYLRNSFFFALALDANPRVHLVRYEDLTRRPEGTLRPLLSSLGLELEPAWIADIEPSAGADAAVREAIAPRIAAVCDALQTRFDECALARV